MFIYNTNILPLSQAQKLISMSVNLLEPDSCHTHEVIHTKNNHKQNMKECNFVFNRYIYVAVAGAVEAAGYILSIPMLRWTGRRGTSVLLYILSGVSLLSILVIPERELIKLALIHLLPYLLTYLFTPWSKVVLEMIGSSQLVKKLPAFYGNRRFITAFTTARHLFLSLARSIQSIHVHPPPHLPRPEDPA
jgi:hypothetical protein